MEKLAPVAFPVHELIQKRWSARAFSNRPIEAEKLQSILEAGRWAASARNLLPWRVIIAERRHPEQFETMLACIKAGNQEWAKEAPVLILAVAQCQFEQDGEMHVNRHAAHDTGLALSQMVLQATALDIFVRMMGGFYPETARELYQIPPSYEPLTMLALGYYGDMARLSEKRREQEQGLRTRKQLDELVFEDTWAQTSKLVTD